MCNVTRTIPFPKSTVCPCESRRVAFQLTFASRENGMTLEYFMILGFCKICNRMLSPHLTVNLFAFMGIVYIL
ncbi:hypothetical protein QZH41_000600 [Actinostola sp. cb2023]|nr:hypothetical protein QZH41_000600 [Actinostola sp. cb2023]